MDSSFERALTVIQGEPVFQRSFGKDKRAKSLAATPEVIKRYTALFNQNRGVLVLCLATTTVMTGQGIIAVLLLLIAVILVVAAKETAGRRKR
ncbi:MAG: hypothetical protein IIB15_01500 [Chloroflexi bacterium]|nr:hypothetical protein [Chloroflexota bacterium]